MVRDRLLLPYTWAKRNVPAHLVVHHSIGVPNQHNKARKGNIRGTDGKGRNENVPIGR